VKWLADENFPVSSYQLLLKYGWDITHIAFVNPSIKDEMLSNYLLRKTVLS